MGSRPKFTRRLDGPDGKIAYESLDYAAVEGAGPNAKVVTASYPFSGYVSSINGFNATGVDTGGAVSNQLTNYAILLFLYDLLQDWAPQRTPSALAIWGMVRRPRPTNWS